MIKVNEVLEQGECNLNRYIEQIRYNLKHVSTLPTTNLYYIHLIFNLRKKIATDQ
jgi:hypothetical protein